MGEMIKEFFTLVTMSSTRSNTTTLAAVAVTSAALAAAASWAFARPQSKKTNAAHAQGNTAVVSEKAKPSTAQRQQAAAEQQKRAPQLDKEVFEWLNSSPPSSSSCGKTLARWLVDDL